jgi:hypothetical protein
MMANGRAICGAISLTMNAIGNDQREGGLPTGPDDPRICLGNLRLMMDATRIVLSEHQEVADLARAAVTQALLKVDMGDLLAVVDNFKRAFNRETTGGSKLEAIRFQGRPSGET